MNLSMYQNVRLITIQSSIVVRSIYRSRNTPGLVTQVIDNVTNLRSSCLDCTYPIGYQYLVMLPIINLDTHWHNQDKIPSTDKEYFTLTYE